MHEDVRSVYFKDVSDPLFTIFQRVRVFESDEDWEFEGEGFICGIKLRDGEHLIDGWWYQILFTSIVCSVNWYSPQFPYWDWEHEGNVKLLEQRGNHE